MSLTNKVVTSGFWQVGATLFEKIISLLVYVIVARIIGVEEFGYIIFCFLVLEFYNFIAGFGVKENIVRVKEMTPSFLNASFWVMLIIGFVLSCATVFIVAPVVEYFSPGPMSMILVSLGFIPILNSVSSIYVGVLQRDFNYKKLAVRGVVASSLSGAVGVSLALNDLGAYALVASKYIYILTNLLILSRLIHLNISLDFKIKEAVAIIRFGFPIMLSQGISYIGDKTMEIIAVSFLGSASLALIDVGRKFITTIYQIFLTPMNTVSLSYFSRSEEKFLAFTNMVTVSSFILFPLILIIGFHAEQLTFLVFGGGWESSSAVTQALSYGVLASCAGWFINNLLISLGEVKLILYFNIIGFVLNLIIALLFVGEGIGVYVFSLVASLSIAVVAKLIIISFKYEFDFLFFIKQLSKPLYSVALMLLGCYSFSSVFEVPMESEGVLALLAYVFASAFIGCSVYGLSVYVFFRKSILRYIREFKSSRR